MPPTRAVTKSASLWQRLWRQSFFKRAFYELLGAILWFHSDQQMLNCGYAEPGEAAPVPPGEPADDRLGGRLYRRLVRDVALEGRDVVELGCGRGGGARLLAREFQPRSYLATDASRMLTLGNRRRPAARVRFVSATATRLPLAAASCDVVLGVEMMHPQSDKAAVLAEVMRVLRPGGVLLLADFFYTRSTSRHAADAFRALIRQTPFTLVAEEDWTANALAALAADSPRRLAAIDRMPRLLRGPALSFAATEQSPLFRQLANGQACYLFFHLRK